MPGLANSDINVIDDVNSTGSLLGANAFFNGQFRDLTGYSSISVSCKSDVASAFSGIFIDWSTDGVTLDLAPQRFTFDPLVISQDGFRVHATVAAKYYRVRYHNGATPQTSFALTALLRKGTPTATVRTIDPLNTFTTNLDVLTTQAILSGVGRATSEEVQLPLMDDVNLPADGPYIFVSPRPVPADNVARKVTPASVAPVQLTDFSRERLTFLSITNDVLRGNLYLQLFSDTGLSTTHFDYKLLPGETWQDPGAFGSTYSGDIYGVWDEAYIQSPTLQLGNAIFVGGYYG